MEETRHSIDYYEGVIDGIMKALEYVELYDSLTIEMEEGVWLEALLQTDKAIATHEQGNILCDMERSSARE